MFFSCFFGLQWCTIMFQRNTLTRIRNIRYTVSIYTSIQCCPLRYQRPVLPAEAFVQIKVPILALRIIWSSFYWIRRKLYWQFSFDIHFIIMLIWPGKCRLSCTNERKPSGFRSEETVCCPVMRGGRYWALPQSGVLVWADVEVNVFHFITTSLWSELVDMMQRSVNERKLFEVFLQ